MKRVIHPETVEREHAAGRRTLAAPRVKVFYVTYPADWAAAASAQRRPG